MIDVPQIYTYEGVPLSEIPRERLEQILIETFTQLQDMQGMLLNRNVQYIRDLAEMAKRR